MARTCFVLMPFSPTFNGIWQTVLRPTVQASGDICFRADDIFAPGLIMNDILRSIREADYIIADLTEQNPNVYYELGLAHALTKPVILITQNTANLPFDLRHQRVIVYSDTAAGAAQLRTVLTQYLSNV